MNFNVIRLHRARKLAVPVTAGLAAVLFLAPSALATDVSTQAAIKAPVIYNSVPAPLPPNVPSLGYQATQTQEFGDDIIFAGTTRRVVGVTVTMSDWALRSDWPTWPVDSHGNWTHPITLNLYNVNTPGATPTLGTLVSSITQTFSIPFRPPADPTCTTNTQWRASDGNCYSGLAFNITFDLTASPVTVPNEVIFGIAFNTTTWGYAPTGTPGPYESLNLGLTNAMPPTVGTDPNADDVFWNTSTPGNYADGGIGGFNTYRRDTTWTPYQTAVKFLAAANPPVEEAQCKNGGWKSFRYPSFKNQAACERYVESNGG
jgi:hypothetical protein